MNGKIVYGMSLIMDPDKEVPSGAVYIENGRVVETGGYDELKRRYPGAEELGSDHHIVMPGFINAHNHGKGVTDFQRGQVDDTLETWKFRSYPPLDPGTDAAWAAVKQLEAGVTTAMHNHDLSDPQKSDSEYDEVIEAYRNCRLKVAFAPTIANRNWFVYGDNEAFVETLPEEVRRICRLRMERDTVFGPAEYMQAVDRLRREYRGEPGVKIMHGPLSPQWVDEDTLRAIRKDAYNTGTRIHIHVQQTKLQNLYGYRHYGMSLLGYLDSLGFLDRDVTIGHAVWISEKDIELLAERGVTVTHHASCNFRVRNGISPVYALLKAGVHVGVGMDDKEFGDDKDFIEEMRLISKLHRLPEHRLDSPHLLPRDVFRMATRYGAETLGWSEEVGTLEPGKKADLVLLDARRITEPFVSPAQSILDLVLYRGGTRDVDMVLVDGEVVVREGRVVHVDREEIIQRLRSSLPSDYEAELNRRNSEYRELRPYIAAWFSDWYDNMGSFEGNPYYHFNNR